MQIRPYSNIYFASRCTNGGACASQKQFDEPPNREEQSESKNRLETPLYAQIYPWDLLKAKTGGANLRRFEEYKFRKIYARMQMAEIDKKQGKKLAVLKTSAVESLFNRDKYFYISPMCGDILNTKFKNYLETDLCIDAPTAVITEDENGLALNFIDGRHRFSVLRDMGMPNIPFSLDRESLKIAKKYGMVEF